MWSVDKRITKKKDVGLQEGSVGKYGMAYGHAHYSIKDINPFLHSLLMQTVKQSIVPFNMGEVVDSISGLQGPLVQRLDDLKLCDHRPVGRCWMVERPMK